MQIAKKRNKLALRVTLSLLIGTSLYLGSVSTTFAVPGINDHPVLGLVGPAHECPAVYYRAGLNNHWNAEPVHAGSDGCCLL